MFQPITTDSVLPGITPHNRAGPIKVTHMAIGSDRYPNINSYPPAHEENTQNKRNHQLPIFLYNYINIYFNCHRSTLNSFVQGYIVSIAPT